MPTLHPDDFSGAITTSDGVALHVEVAGNGLPCLYVHGGPGSGSYWARKFTGDIFERNFRMVYVDQRGACRSASPPDGNYAMDRMILDFEEIRSALNIDSWLTMGHSFAGLLQMGYAMRHPDGIRGMLLINPALNLNETFRLGYCPKACEFLGITDPTPYTDPAIPLLERWNALIEKLKENDLMWKLGYERQENEWIMNDSFAEIPNFNNDYVAMLEVKDYWQDFKPFTPNIQAPVLYFYGKRDWMTGPEHFRGAEFPNLLLWGSEGSHMPFLEDKTGLDQAILAYRQWFQL